jgi:hypothetical protein
MDMLRRYHWGHALLRDQQQVLHAGKMRSLAVNVTRAEYVLVPCAIVAILGSPAEQQEHVDGSTSSPALNLGAPLDSAHNDRAVAILQRATRSRWRGTPCIDVTGRWTPCSRGLCLVDYSYCTVLLVGCTLRPLLVDQNLVSPISVVSVVALACLVSPCHPDHLYSITALPLFQRVPERPYPLSLIHPVRKPSR